MPDTVPARVRVGVFELDLKSGELRQGDRKVVLQEQPLQILQMLVERQTEIVTREFVPVDRLWLGSKQFQLRTLGSIAAGLYRHLLRMNADLVAQRRAAVLSKSAARRSWPPALLYPQGWASRCFEHP
jgi:DNA-binding winged helix-turn-helix (wHTH) protein